MALSQRQLKTIQDIKKNILICTPLSTMNEIINTLMDAITASGKKFTEIPSETIFQYLRKVGIPANKHNEIYKNLGESYGIKTNYGTSGSVTMGDSQRNTSKQIVDYTDTSHNDVKKREPRKTVFSEIKKL